MIVHVTEELSNPVSIGRGSGEVGGERGAVVNVAPSQISIDFDAIPSELRQLRQWVVWRLEDRKGKLTKIPYQVDGKNKAMANVPATWGTFDQAVRQFRAREAWRNSENPRLRADALDGIGFEFSDNRTYCGIDLDRCRDRDTGEIAPWAQRIIDAVGSYSEVSPSGTGVKIWAEGRLGGDGRKTPVKADGKPWKKGDPEPAVGAIEMYDRARYFTVTGQRIDGTPATVEKAYEVVLALYRELLPEKPKPETVNGKHHANGHVSAAPDDSSIIDIALRAKNGNKFRKLWEGTVTAEDYPSRDTGELDHSSADLALCNYLAFYCGPDSERIDRLFRQSKLYREKWDRPDYSGATIAKAIDACNGKYYNPSRHKSDFSCTDMGNADRLVHHCGDILRYCDPWKKWLVYCDGRWQLDSAGMVVLQAKKAARLILREAADIEDEKERDARLSWARTSQSSKSINAMISLAQSELPISPDDLDRDPWLFNVQNGTIDLHTGELREHRREDYITQICPVAFDPHARADVWEETLSTIFAGSDELINYVWKLFGYSLLGLTSEQILAIFHGVGANGKSTIINAYLDMMGRDYAMKAPPDLLMVRHGENHPTERACLFRKRFVAAIETDDGRRLAEGLVKELTGGDKIRARRMREDFWEFDPTHTVVLVGNHLPKIWGTDHAIWRRIRLVPFSVIIPPEQQDKQLNDKLRAEFPGILAWCVRGCLAWQQEGLGSPACVMAATEGYQRAEDVLGLFIDECCDLLPELRTQASTIVQNCKQWAERNGYPEFSGKRIGDYLTKVRGLEKYTSNGTIYKGIGIKPRGTE